MSQDHKKSKVTTKVLKFADVKRMAEVADERISLTHSEGPSYRKSKLFFKEDGKTPAVAYYKKQEGVDKDKWMEVTKAAADRYTENGQRERWTHLPVNGDRKEILTPVVEAEFKSFLQQFLVLLVDNTMGRNGSNTITTSVITKKNVMDAERDAKLHGVRAALNRKTGKNERVSAVSLALFKRIMKEQLRDALNESESELSKTIQFGSGATELIRDIAEARISDLFKKAQTIVGTGHRVNVHHFNKAVESNRSNFNIQR